MASRLHEFAANLHSGIHRIAVREASRGHFDCFVVAVTICNALARVCDDEHRKTLGLPSPTAAPTDSANNKT